MYESTQGASAGRQAGGAIPTRAYDTGASVNRGVSVASLLEDNFGTLLSLIAELRDLEGGLGTVLAQRPPAPLGNGAKDPMEPPTQVVDRLQVHGEGLRHALAHVQELRARLML